MPEHELWVTALFNKYLAEAGNAALALVGMYAENPDEPWANYVTMQFVVVLILVIVFAILRPRLSMDRPGKTQHIFEVIYQFLRGQSEEIVGPQGPKYLHFFATLFLFILFANELGVFPTFESPTMYAAVPLGCAVFFVSFALSFVGCARATCEHPRDPWMRPRRPPLPCAAGESDCWARGVQLVALPSFPLLCPLLSGGQRRGKERARE